jgi:predicted DNA-binding protein
MTTPSRKAKNKYNAKAYKQLNIRLKPETIDEFNELQKELGLSRMELIKELLRAYKEPGN